MKLSRWIVLWSQVKKQKTPEVNEIKAAINKLKEECELERAFQEKNRENVFCADLQSTEK